MHSLRRILYFVWPPAELLDIPHDEKEGGNESAALDTDIDIWPAESKRRTPKDALALAERIFDSEQDRRKSIEDKAGSFLFALSVAAGIVGAIPIFFTERLGITFPWVIPIVVVLAFSLVFFLTATFYAVKVRRVGETYVLSADDYSRMTSTHEGARARLLIEITRRNEPLIRRKSNFLYLTEEMFLRGLLLVGVSGLLIIFVKLLGPSPVEAMQQGALAEFKQEVVKLNEDFWKSRIHEVSEEQSRHAEFIQVLQRLTEALDHHTLDAPSTTFDGVSLLGAITLAFILLPLAFAIIWWKGHKRTWIAMAIVLPTAFLIGGFTLQHLLKVETMFGLDFRGMHLLTINVHSKGDFDSGTDRQPTASDSYLDCGHGDLQVVGPFADGRYDTGLNLETKLASVAGVLHQKQVDHHLLGLILVGVADKRPLRQPQDPVVASNSGLARARAEWVKSKLVNSLDPMTGDILTLSSGPVHILQNASPSQLAEDRSVRVCAAWGAKLK